MITSFNIENFRCFKKLQINNLRSINIIVGSNASGKTALMEAIRVAIVANPGDIIPIIQGRGLQFMFREYPSQDEFETLWKDLFHNVDTKQKISFSFTDSDNKLMSLKIFFDESRMVTSIPSSDINGGTGPSIIAPLKFERYKDKKKSEIYASIGQDGKLLLQQKTRLGPVIGFFVSTQIPSMTETAGLFSDLSLSGKEGNIIEIIRKVFPFIKGLTVLSPFNQPAIYISQKNFPVKIPATLISSGVNKLLSLIIGITSHRKGITLVDEIENGFYYKTLPEMWNTLLKITKENEGQLFASTHSWECLKAATSAIRQDDNAFSLIRTSKGESDCTAEVFYGSDVLSAIEADIEVR